MSKVSKISIARSIFASNLALLLDGSFKEQDNLRPYKAFRSTVIKNIEVKCGITGASAATTFNQIRNESIKSNPQLEQVLGRDPKVVVTNTKKVTTKSPETA